MNLQQQLNQYKTLGQLDLLAKQIVEGYLSGIHKSPFHGYSAEFAEHKPYNTGQSTKHIDWKRYAKTEKLYVKKYEEETNMRCHIILDNSGSMHYPQIKKPTLSNFNKISFSIIASAALLLLLKKQRDAFGLSIYSDKYEYYAPDLGSERHYQKILGQLEKTLLQTQTTKTTQTSKQLYQIAEKIKKRSLIVLFTDMLEANQKEEALFHALRNLKYNKHEVVLFHVVDNKNEVQLKKGVRPTKFIDVETGESVIVKQKNIKELYQKNVEQYFHRLSLKCKQYKINYVPADINTNFESIITQFLLSRQKFV